MAATSWKVDCGMPIADTHIRDFTVGFSNQLERFVLGSVSVAVAARAHCSVEVIRSKSKEQQ